MVRALAGKEEAGHTERTGAREEHEPLVELAIPSASKRERVEHTNNTRVTNTPGPNICQNGDPSGFWANRICTQMTTKPVRVMAMASAKLQ